MKITIIYFYKHTIVLNYYFGFRPEIRFQNRVSFNGHGKMQKK